MAAETTNGILDRLYTLHARSLLNFLVYAPPWSRDRMPRVEQVLAEIASDQRATAERIGRLISRHRGTMREGPFPSRFSAFHDLSIDFMLDELIRRQDELVATMERCLPDLQGAPTAVAVVQEALGMAKGHADALAALRSEFAPFQE